ncbi:hypothetical protein HZB74_00705 [Candidatus Saccharibacteria bacterium]|nr:hypothetical protein [Candidatus Saccharibacteria bacterium]
MKNIYRNTGIKIQIVLTVLFLSLIIQTAPFDTSKVHAQNYYPELISQSTEGQFTNDDSGDTLMSDDGRYVAFLSQATNLSSQTTNTEQIYLRDRGADTTKMVSVNSDGMPQDGQGLRLTGLSGDGRYVFFAVHYSTNIDPRTSGTIYQFRHDSLLGQTSVVSFDDNNNLIGSDFPIDSSYDGNKFAITLSESGGFPKTYIRDMAAGSSQEIAEGINKGLSSDGTKILYQRQNSFGYQIVELFDSQTQNTQRIDVTQTGVNSDYWYNVGSYLSGDGRYAYFESHDPNMLSTTPGECEFRGCVYRRDLNSGMTKQLRISIGQADIFRSADFNELSFSRDGNSAIFPTSNSETGLVFLDTNTLEYHFFGYNQDDLAPDINEAGSLSISANGQLAAFSNRASNFGVPPACSYVEPQFASLSASAIAQNLINCANVFVSSTAPPLNDDVTPPVVTGTPDRAANSFGWYNADVTINWESNDPAPSSGSPNVPSATVASTEGINTFTSGQSCDPAGNCSTGSIQLSIDKTLPTSNFSGNQLILRFLGRTISGSASDSISGVHSVVLSSGSTSLSSQDGGISLSCTGGNCSWSANRSRLPSGLRNYTLTVTDFAGNTTSINRFFIVI